jgi:hypothetical protein
VRRWPSILRPLARPFSPRPACSLVDILPQARPFSPARWIVSRLRRRSCSPSGTSR